MEQRASAPHCQGGSIPNHGSQFPLGQLLQLFAKAFLNLNKLVKNGEKW
jgi:hypothetical protein